MHELLSGISVGVWGYLLLELSCGPVPTKHGRAQLRIVRRRISLSRARCNCINDVCELQCRDVRGCRIECLLKLRCRLVRGECRLELVHDLLGGDLSSWSWCVGVLELCCGAILKRCGRNARVNLL